MKNAFILIILFNISNISCVSKQKKENLSKNSIISQKTMKIDKIEITEQTRGTNRIITFTPGFLNISLNGNITQTEILSSEWENIAAQASLINLSKISTYQSPTTGRFSDKALASTISITSNGNSYTSESFDAGIPPKELEGLYQLLRNKSGMNKKSKSKN